MARHTDQAAEFAYLLRVCGADLPEPQREYRFHPSRKWRFDFGYPAHKVAVEVDGGQWKAGGGRHNTDEDRDKLNEAAALGWRVLRFSPKQVRDQGGQCVDVLRRALTAIGAIQEPGP